MQDADRIDKMGAIGIGRKFIKYGAKNEGKGNMQDVVRREFEKIYKLEGTIKTEAGRRLAKVMMERCRLFTGWWAEEQGIMGDQDLEVLGNFPRFGRVEEEISWPV